MVLLKILFLLFAFTLIYGFITQVILPMVNGHPLFPLLRSSTAKEKLEAVEEKLEETLDVAEFQKRVSDLADKVSSTLNKK